MFLPQGLGLVGSVGPEQGLHSSIDAYQRQKATVRTWRDINPRVATGTFLSARECIPAARVFHYHQHRLNRALLITNGIQFQFRSTTSATSQQQQQGYSGCTGGGFLDEPQQEPYPFQAAQHGMMPPPLQNPHPHDPYEAYADDAMSGCNGGGNGTGGGFGEHLEAVC